MGWKGPAKRLGRRSSGAGTASEASTEWRGDALAQDCVTDQAQRNEFAREPVIRRNAAIQAHENDRSRPIHRSPAPLRLAFSDPTAVVAATHSNK